MEEQHFFYSMASSVTSRRAKVNAYVWRYVFQAPTLIVSEYLQIILINIIELPVLIGDALISIKRWLSYCVLISMCISHSNN